MVYEDERMQILEMIESGKVSAAEGLLLLKSLVNEAETSPLLDIAKLEDGPDISTPAPERPDISLRSHEHGPEVEDAEPVSEQDYPQPTYPGEPVGLPSDAAKWRAWWVIPLWIGVGVTVIAGSLMYVALQASGIGFWFVCAALLFMFGLLLMMLAWHSRTARWLHLRIQQRPGRTPSQIALSFPLPIRLTAWFFRTFRDYIPGLRNTSIDEIILALDHSATPENPLFISVNDEEAGETVQIFIG